MPKETTVFVTANNDQNKLAMEALRHRLLIRTMEEWSFEDDLELRCHTQFFEDGAEYNFIQIVKKVLSEMIDTGELKDNISVSME